jgi:hypothetical protein
MWTEEWNQEYIIGTRRRDRELKLMKETIPAKVRLLNVLVDFTF